MWLPEGYIYRPIKETLQLLTTDGKIFTVNSELLRQSMTIRKLIEAAENSLDDVKEPIVIKKTTAATLTKLLQFMAYHHLDPIFRDDKENEDKKLCSWDMEYFKEDNSFSLTELLISAYELKVYRLIDVGCKKIASSFRGKSTEEMREIMGMSNMTPQEEEKLRRRVHSKHCCAHH